MLTIVTRLEEILGLSLSDDFRNFICDFYTEALTAKLIEVMRSKQPYDREKLIRFISITFQASLPEVIKRACKEE